MKKQAPKPKDWTRHYDDRSILDDITDESVDLILDDRLRKDIISGKRKRKLKNVTIKIDPLQIRAIKKLSTMKSIPYQTASSKLACRGDQIGAGSGIKIGKHRGHQVSALVRSQEGKGKRGGARVIHYWKKSAHGIWLLPSCNSENFLKYPPTHRLRVLCY